MIPLLLLGSALAGPAFDHDYTAMDKALEGLVSPEGVRYDVLAERRALLDAQAEAIAGADLSTFTDAQRLALYVNAYNLYTLITVLDAQPLRSIRDLDGGQVWKTRRFAVAGQLRTLDDLEHVEARPMADGRIHAVINCASRGCPPLPPDPLRAEGLEQQLDEAARRWVTTNAFHIEGDTLQLSRIFDWYGDDFAEYASPSAGKPDRAVNFIIRYAPDEMDRRVAATTRRVFGDYDWTLNAAGR